MEFQGLQHCSLGTAVLNLVPAGLTLSGLDGSGDSGALTLLPATDTWRATYQLEGDGTSSSGAEDVLLKVGQPVEIRVALNSGPVVVGDVGSSRRVDYTVLGNTVNVAARIEAYVAEAKAKPEGERTDLVSGMGVEFEDVRPEVAAELRRFVQTRTADYVVTTARTIG